MDFLSSSTNEFFNDPKSNKLFCEPFDHIVIDNFINEGLIATIIEEHKEYFSKSKNQLDFCSPLEVKNASVGGEINLGHNTKSLIRFLNSQTILEKFKKIFRIKEDLMPDPYLYGGGLHLIRKGGFLNLHVDFPSHPNLKLDRRLNLLLYLNPNWEKSWNGDLVLVDIKGTKHKSISPLLNRAVVFNTNDFTYHGHPHKLDCPAHVSRRSLALYYYSNGRPKSERRSKYIYQSTLFGSIDKENKFKPDRKRLSLRNFIRSFIN